MTVHSVLPEALSAAVDAVLGPAGVVHVAHREGDSAWTAATASADESAVALIGPVRSADVAEAVEATAPAGMPLLAPLATWAGVTRDDEPGCDDAARHRGTVLRLVARDTEVARRVSAALLDAGQRALVVAGDHDYGRQLDGQLRVGGLPRTDDAAQADVVVLAGLAGEPEIERAAALSPVPIIAFDGAQGGQLGTGREVRLALPIAPRPDTDPAALLAGTEQARRAAELVVDALKAGARDRPTLLADLRKRGPFDAYGDPVDPPVWLWRVRNDWALEADQRL